MAAVAAARATAEIVGDRSIVEHVDAIGTLIGELRDGPAVHVWTIDAGGDPDYDGYSGPITLNGVGDPMEASYGVLTMGADNRIDDELTEFLPAKGADSADVAAVPVEGTRAGDGVSLQH